MRLPKSLERAGAAAEPAAEVRPNPAHVRRLYDAWSELVGVADELPPQHRDSTVRRLSDAAKLHARALKERDRTLLADVVDLLTPNADDPVIVHQYLEFALQALAMSLMPAPEKPATKPARLTAALRAYQAKPKGAVSK